MDVREAILTRTSIRSYQNKPIEAEKLGCVLDAGRQAPTAKNEQAHKVITVTDASLKEKLVTACHNQRMVGEAPVVLIVCANNAHEMACGQSARVIDSSIALSFMMLQATELGLSTCWLGSFSEQSVRELLHIPDDYVIVAVSPLGYAAEESREHRRNPLDSFVVSESF